MHAQSGLQEPALLTTSCREIRTSRIRADLMRRVLRRPSRRCKLLPPAAGMRILRVCAVTRTRRRIQVSNRGCNRGRRRFCRRRPCRRSFSTSSTPMAKSGRHRPRPPHRTASHRTAPHRTASHRITWHPARHGTACHKPALPTGVGVVGVPQYPMLPTLRGVGMQCIRSLR